MSSFATAGRLRQQDPSINSRQKYDRELWLLLAGLTALYIVVVFFSGRRYVWFDELFTFDIARASTLARMWEMIRNFDANPPASYFLSRWSMSIFGQNPWGLRMPSIIEFYLGSIAVLFFVRRKAGLAFALLAVLIIWASGAFFYAVEARPYALLFMSAAFLLLGWDTATHAQDRKLAVWVVALASLGMFSAHAFAPFSLLPFLAAEAMRFWRRRKPDYALWAALLLPAVAMILYIPLFETYKLILFPKAFQASLPRLAEYFYDSVSSLSLTLLVALIAAMVVAGPGGNQAKGSKLRAEDYVLFSVFVLIPALLTIVLIHRQGAFWDRYAITTQIALYAGFAIWLARRCGFSRRAGYAGYAASLIMVSLVMQRDVLQGLRNTTPANEDALASVRPDLPLVDASELTFFEMNHYESPQLLSRLYYLRDRDAAVRYAHASMFEDFEPPDRLKPYFPISANVDPYNLFVHQHNQFLVFGTADYPEDWLLPKLEADGARLSVLGTYKGPYKDSTLYLVVIPAAVESRK
jgi:hypothetical protein